MSSPAVLVDEEFGQRVDLTVRIREVLRNYPSGPAIIQEMIQNSDDAGASVVKLCYDQRSHGVESLAYPGLRDFQGPSLLSYNDAVFSAGDFASIQQIGNSGKTSVAGKTGRFGLGFNASYHLSDVPSFVSGSHIVYFDPHATHLPLSDRTNPGKRINFLATGSGVTPGTTLLDTYPDQFSPFLAFGCTLREEFRGTLFRFPLRTAAQGLTSRLSSHAYSSSDMESLLTSVYAEASEMLLFLKSVQRIEVHRWRDGADQPDLVFATHVSNMTPGLRAHRAFLTTQPDLASMKADVSFIDEVHLTTERFDSQATTSRDTWLVSNRLSAGVARDIAVDPSNAHFKFLPWAGVAACLSRASHVPLHGRAFVFLPLPVSTALPVHVNGFFELSSNRRDLWWRGGDMVGDGALRGRWNEVLCADILAPAYAALLARASRMLGAESRPTEHLYALCPQETHTSEAWRLVIESTYALLQDTPILLTPTRTWITPRDAVAVDETLPATGGSQPSADSNAVPFVLAPGFGPLGSILLACGLPVVRMPSRLQHLLAAHGLRRDAATCGPRTADPTFVRSWLVRLGSLPSVLVRAHALFLLRVCLSDVNSTSPNTYLHLVGLPLLPLLDGTFARFDTREKACETHVTTAATESDAHLTRPTTFFVLGEADLREGVATLLAGAAHSILATDLDESLATALAAPPAFVHLNLAPLTEAALANHLLPLCLPRAWSRADVVEWHEPATTAKAVTPSFAIPSRDFLLRLWSYIARSKNVRLFTAYPLVLCQPGALAGPSDAISSLPLLVRLDPSTHLLHPGSEETSVTPFSVSLTSCFSHLRLHVLDLSIAPMRLPHSSLLDLGLVSKPTLPRAIAMLSSVFASQPSRLTAFAKCTREQRCALREWIGAQLIATAHPLTSEEAALIRAFPIFQVHADPEPFVRRIVPPNGAADTVEEWSDEDAAASSFVDLLQTRMLPPPAALVPPALLSAHFVLPSLRSDVGLYSALGLSATTAADFYRDHYFASRTFAQVHPQERDEVMLRVLADAPVLAKQNPTFMGTLAALAFVSGRGGLLHKPCELYDPLVTDLAQLLDAEAHFPQAPFNTPDVVPTLRTLGLQTQLNRQGILESALSVYKIAQRARTVASDDGAHAQAQSSQALSRARALLSYVDSHAARLFAEDSRIGAGDVPRAQWLASLRAIPWLPVLVEAPLPILPWNDDLVHGRTSKSPDPPFLAAPAETQPISSMWSASYSLRVLDHAGVVSSLVANHFGWEAPLDVKVVVNQLLQLSAKLAAFALPLDANSTPTAVITPQAATDDTRRSEHRDLLEQLLTTLPQIYLLISRRVFDGSAQSQAATLDTVRHLLHGHEWVFVGDRFVSSDRVAFSTSASVHIDCEPYFYRMPHEWHIFATMMRALGVREAFQTLDYLDVLHSMAAVYGSTSNDDAGNKSAAAKPLSSRDLEMAINIVQLMSDHTAEVHSAIYVPTELNTLALAGSLVYQDAQWLSGRKVASLGNRTPTFVHPKVSNGVAAKVGVQSYRSQLLDVSESIAIGDTAPAVGQAFGQKESLTQRLRNILALYPEGVGAIYELLQNADDARATQMTLMFNADSYGTSSLLSPQMAAWQGPALYAWNNARFTDEDYQNLAHIGQGSKLDKLAATGRFGLGFNASYHLSDVPSFVSGSHIVYFDPHAAHLPRVTHREPGLRIPASATLLDNFRDQFTPFLHFGYDLQKGADYDGTLFRFPLRTAATAAKSSIKREVMTKEDMLRLLDSFRNVVVEAMLFLRHIVKIEVQMHEHGQTRVLYSAELRDREQRSKGAWAKIHEFTHGTSTVPRALAVTSSNTSLVMTPSQLSKAAFFKRLETCSEEDLPSGFQIAHIRFDRCTYTESESTAVSSPSVSPEDASDSIEEGELLSPRTTRVFTLKETVSSTDTFILCEQVGSGRSRQMAVEGAKRGLKMLPFGGVAAHILHNGSLVSPLSLVARCGKASCFLPLPVTTGLPVNINAFFELSANRRDVWWGSDMTGDGAVRSEWNRSLLLDVVAPSYARLLAGASRLFGTSSPLCYQLFPRSSVSNSSATNEAWQVLTARVFGLMQNVPLLFTPTMAWKEPSVAPAQRTRAAATALRGFDYARLVADIGVDIANKERVLEQQGQGQWIAPKHAVTIDGSATATDASNSQTRATTAPASASSGVSLAVAESPLAFSEFGRLGSILLSCGIPVVDMPAALRKRLVMHAKDGVDGPVAGHSTTSPTDADGVPSPGPRIADATFVRTWLSGLGRVPSVLSRDDALFLLEYVLADLDPTSFDRLRGCPLVPLADGSFGVFESRAATSDTFFLLSHDDVRSQLPELLHAASHRLIATGLSASIMRVMNDRAFLAWSNIDPMSEGAVATLLHHAFPKSWQGHSIVEYTEMPVAPPAAAVAVAQTRPAPGGVPSLAWIQLLWTYINRHVQDLSLFTSLPIVLATSHRAPPSAAAPTNEPRKHFLCSLSLACPLVVPSKQHPFPAPMLSILGKLGVFIVESALTPITHESSSAYLPTPTVGGLLDCLSRVCGGDGKRMSGLIAKSLPSERSALRDWIGRGVSDRVLEGGLNMSTDEKQIDFLRHFHIFEAFGELAQARPIIPTAQPVVRPGALGAVSPPTTPTPASPTPKRFVFVDLTAADRFIPPRGMLESLLTSRFLKVNLAHDVQLLLLLGVKQMSEAAFYTEYVFPPSVLAKITPAERNDTMVRVLQELPSLQKSDPRFLEQLLQLRFLPSKLQSLAAASVATSSSTQSPLHLIQDLFDPSVVEFQSLLDPAVHYPAAPFDEPQVLQQLVRLGLQTNLDRRALLDVAANIVAVVSHHSNLNHPAVQTERERSKALLRYLDLHSGRLLEQDPDSRTNEADSESGRVQQEEKSSPISSTSSSAATVTPDRFVSRADFISRLGDLPWWPALLTSPTPNLPWRCVTDSVGAPYAIGSQQVVAPSFAFSSARRIRPVSAAWFCSFTLKLLDGEVRSEAVSKAFGWNDDFAPIVLCQQIIQLSAAASKAVAHPTFATQVSAVVPRIYQQLTSQLTPPTDEEPPARHQEYDQTKKIIAATLKNHACVLLNSSWFTASRVAFPPGSVDAGESAAAVSVPAPDARPYLHHVTAELMPYATLLRLIGIRPHFEASDYAFVLKRMSQELNSRNQLHAARVSPPVAPLPPLSAAASPQVDSAAVQLLPPPSAAFSSSAPSSISPPSVPPPPSAQLSARELDLAISIVDYLAHLQEERNKQVATSALPAGGSSTAVSSKHLLVSPSDLFVPTEKCTLLPATSAAYNDAVWLMATLANKDAIHFVHARISNARAATLGIKSLRELLMLNRQFKKDIICPTSDKLKRELVDLIGPQADLNEQADEGGAGAPVASDPPNAAGIEALTTAVLDLVELGDALGAREVKVVFDERRFPSESLFNPLLAEAQGPALLIYFDTVILSEEAVLLQKAALADDGLSLPPHARLAASKAFSSSSSSSSASAPTRGHAVHHGHGLLSAYAFSDSLFLLSGESLYIFDPAKRLFLESSPDEQKAAALPMPMQPIKVAHSAAAAPKVEPSFGRQYTYVDGGLAARFHDQFLPFESTPFRFSKSKPFSGTIMRLPLRNYNLDSAALTAGPGSRANGSLTDACITKAVMEQVIGGLKRHYAQLLLFTRRLESFQLSVQPPHHQASTLKICSSHVQVHRHLSAERVKLIDDESWKKNSRGGLFGIFGPTFQPLRNSYEIELSTMWCDPRAASAANAAAQAIETSVDSYLICECLGEGASRDIALRWLKECEGTIDAGRPRVGRDQPAMVGRIVPIASAAIRLKHNGQNAEALSNARIFCGGVPLIGAQMPPTGLRMHINANFAIERKECGRFVHLDAGYRREFCAEWDDEIAQRTRKIDALKARSADAPSDSPPPPQPPSNPGSPSNPFDPSSPGAATDSDDWVPRKPQDGGSSGGGGGGGGGGGSSPPPPEGSPRAHHADEDEHKDAPAPPSPSAQSLQLSQRRLIIAPDTSASHRSPVHRYNLELLTQCGVSAYVDLLLHLKTLFEKHGSRSLLYHHWPFSVTAPLLYRRLVLRCFYTRICIDNSLPLFLTSSGEFVPLRSALFAHAAMGMLVEGFMTRYGQALFQVPQGISDDIILCGVVEPLQQTHAPSAPLISPSVCTPHEFRRLLRTHQGMKASLASGVSSEVSRELLRFALIGLAATPYTNEKYDEIGGLRLVPLANGTAGVFGSTRFVIASAAAQSLLQPLASHIFVSAACIADPELAPHLLSPSFRRHYFADFDARCLVEHLPRLFPRFKQVKTTVVSWQVRGRDWKAAVDIEDKREDEQADANEDAQSRPAGGGAVSSASAPRPLSFTITTDAGLPTPQWIRLLWQCIDLHDPEARHLLSSWPLVPIQTKQAANAHEEEQKNGDSSSSSSSSSNDTLMSHQLATVSLFPHILCLPSAESWNQSSDVASALVELGYPILDWSLLDARCRVGGEGPSAAWCVADRPEQIPSKLLRSLPDLFFSSQLNLNLSSLRAPHCDTLLKLINAGFEQGSLTITERRTVQMLPIFETYQPVFRHADIEPPVFRSIEQTQRPQQLYILAPELLVSMPEEFLSFLAQQHVFLQWKFQPLYRWLGVAELTLTQVLERYLATFLEQNFASPSAAAGAIDADRQDAFITQHLVGWVKESVLSAETKRQVAALPIIPVSSTPTMGAQTTPTHAESKEDESMAVSSSSSSSSLARVPASSLYDPRNRFFSELFLHSHVFPSAAYQTTELLDFLVALGMKNKMDADAFIMCARKIEESGLARKQRRTFIEHQEYIERNSKGRATSTEMSTDSETGSATQASMPTAGATSSSELSPPASDLSVEESRLYTVSTRLLAHLISHFTDLSSPQLYKSLREIRWVPVVFRDQRCCVKFEQAAVWKDRYLAWTDRPVLPVEHSPPEVIQAQLGLQSPPPVDSVMRHLQQLTSVPLDAWEQRLSLHGETELLAPVKIFLDLFAFLDREWGRLSSSHQSLLRKLPLVPMSNQLVRPSRLYFRLGTGSLAPFLFEIPRVFGQYDTLLTHLGATAAPTRRDFMRLLHELYVDLQPDRALNVNELQTVIKILKLIADDGNATEEEADQKRSARSGPAVASASAASLLYVPDELTRLVPAFSCVFNNSAWLSQRIDHRRVDFVNGSISQELAKKCGVRAITDAIEEKLEQLVNVGDEDGGDGGAVLSQRVCASLQKLCQSAQFTRGILRLFEDQISRTQNYAQWPLLPSAESLHALLSDFSLQFVMGIRTRLLLLPDRIDVTLEEDRNAEGASQAPHGSLAFVHVDFAGRTIYVNMNSSEIGAVRPTLILANALAHVLEHAAPQLDALRNLTPLNSMLDTALAAGESDDPVAMLQPLLDRLEILRIDHISLRRGVPGELLHPFDAELMELSPLRQYLPGELVAFRDHAGSHRYGEIVRVEDASLGGGLFSSLLVRIQANKNALISSADLFSFRTRMTGAHTNAEEAEKLMQANQRMQQQMAKQADQRHQRTQQGAAASALTRPAADDSEVHMPVSITSAPASSLPSSPSSSSSSPLSAADAQLLSAVSSLLHQARLPLSLDAASLLRDHLALRHQYESLERQSRETHAREAALNSRIERLMTAYVCSVCADAECNLVLVRCGHQICSGCEARLVDKSCPFCRNRYERTIPFFRPEA